MSKKSCKKVCIRCGKEFEAESGYVKYCDDCLLEIKKERRLKQNKLDFQKRQKKLLEGIEGVDYIIDKWNGYATKLIGGKWMNIQHPGKTLDDYIKEFPDAPLICKSTSNKISKNSKSFMNTPEMKKKYSELMKGDKNPNAKCNTTEEQRKSISPFSKSFKNYEGMTDEEKEINIKKFLKSDKIGRNTNQIEYWTNKGYSIDEAKEKVSERQATFTLEKCIKKYGIKNGYKIWKERQKKWIKSLHRSFLTNGDNRTPTSKFENECKQIICKYLNIDVPEKQKYISDKKGNNYSYDLTIGHKIIEFNGDYWHMNPQIYSADSYNKVKNQTAIEIWNHDKSKLQCANEYGYDVLVIWESEYIKNKEDVIRRCLEFLKQ